MYKQLVAYSVASPLHLINFLAFWFVHKQDYKRVIVFVNCYWGYNIIPNKYLDFCKKNNMEVYIDKEHKRDEIIFSNNHFISDLVFISNVALRVFFKYYNKIQNVILIDEGLSTYSGFKNAKNANKREKNRNISFLTYFFKKALQFFIEEIFYKKSTINFLAFSKKNGLMKEEYRESLHQLFSFMYSKDLESDKYRDIIIFCTQPFVDLGVMTEKDFSLYLLKIQDQVYQKGYSLLIKKHPVEKKFDYEKYGFNVLDYDGIFEEYVFIHSIRGMISAMSTSSVLVPALYGINSFVTDYAMVNELSKVVEIIFKNYTQPLDDL